MKIMEKLSYDDLDCIIITDSDHIIVAVVPMKEADNKIIIGKEYNYYACKDEPTFIDLDGIITYNPYEGN